MRQASCGARGLFFSYEGAVGQNAQKERVKVSSSNKIGKSSCFLPENTVK
jgi:hypothetical protein